MTWQTLIPIYKSEADIQAFFESWLTGVPEWRAAGSPGWLAEMVPGGANQRISTGLGYGFRPDLLARSRGEDLLFELKCARKYEPLALVEVLHHAWMLSHTSEVGGAAQAGARRTPVVVTQYSAWLRAAFAFLVEHGLSRSAIKHLEFTTLQANSDTLLWFDEPHASWSHVEAPTLPDGLFVEQADWYRVDDSETWIAMKKQEKKLEQRPPLWTAQYLMLTVIADRDEVVTWDGLPEGSGRYLLWGPRGDGRQTITIHLP